MFGAVLDGVVGRVGVPTDPDDSQPGPAQHADGLGVAFAAGARVGVEGGRPWAALPGVVGEDVQGLAGSAVGGRRKWTPLVLPDARVTGVVAPASAAACSALLAWSRIGPSSASSCAWLSWPTRGSLASTSAFGCLASRVVMASSRGDGSQQGGKQVDLGAHQLGQHGWVEPDRRAWARTRSRLRRHCCIRAEGVTDEFQSGGWFHSEGDENGSKRPIVNAVRGVPASKWRAPVLIARCNSATRTAVLSLNRELPRWVVGGLTSAFLGKAGSRMRVAVDPGSRLADVVATGQMTGGAVRRTEQERLAELEAKNAFQNRTLRAIRVVAEKAPPEEARRALRAIDALAKEALAEAHPANEHRATE